MKPLISNWWTDIFIKSWFFLPCLQYTVQMRIEMWSVLAGCWICALGRRTNTVQDPMDGTRTLCAVRKLAYERALQLHPTKVSATT